MPISSITIKDAPAKDAPPINKEHCEYMRLVFTAYWTDASPSTEDIYVSDQRWAMTMSYANIQAVQAYVLNLIQTNITANQCLGVILQGYIFLELDAADKAALGWRVVTGSGVVR